MKRSWFFVAAVLVFVALISFMPASPSLAGESERVLVEFAPGSASAVRSAAERAGGQVHYQFNDLNLLAVTLPTAALQGIARNPNVVAIASDELRYPMAQTTPWGIGSVQAPLVWPTATGSGVKVCVIDSGLYTAHEDIAVSSTGYPTGWNSDACGHGTHVAGTIAAANNNLGVVGVSPGVSLYIVKVFGDSCAWSYSSDLIDATNRCESAGAKIISMSLGGAKGIGPWEERQFNNLWNRGILSIAAAGNAGNTTLSYPASYSSVVSVAATDVNNVVASFSQQNSQVELAAPGVGVLSTVPWQATATLTVGGVTYQGSHMEGAATGSVSGALVNGGLCTGTGAWSGKVILCERGDISFYDKVMNVQNSGGKAAVIYNNVPGGFSGTLGDGTSTIPAISLSQEDGQYLVANKLGQTGSVVSTLTKPASGYEAWDGTSMATPHVSGVAALLWSSNSTLTNSQIRTAMQATALDLGPAGRDNAYGYGLVQAYAALQYLGGAAPNQPPTANFSYTTSGLAATFTDASTDSDGTVVVWSWNFGDGATSTAQNPTHTYAADGTYTVSLTVTDDDGATASASQNVTVSSGSGGGTLYVFDIAMSGKKAGSNRSAIAVVTIKDTNGNVVSGATVSADWSGATSGSVSGITDSNGTVSFESAKVRNTETWTFTVTNVAKDGFTYSSGLNNVTTATITVP